MLLHVVVSASRERGFDQPATVEQLQLASILFPPAETRHTLSLELRCDHRHGGPSKYSPRHGEATHTSPCLHVTQGEFMLGRPCLALTMLASHAVKKVRSEPFERVCFDMILRLV